MPERMPSVSLVKKILTLASRAPSVHNSQPWRWVLGEHTVRLFVDRRRLVHVADQTGREAIISCGAVLDHARVAFEAAGWTVDINRFPDPGNRDQLATIVFRSRNSVADRQLQLADAILRRRTDRLPLGEPSHWPARLAALRRAVEDTGVWVQEIAEEDRPRLIEASRRTELLRRVDTAYQNELQCWTTPFTLYDGIPPEDLPTASQAAQVDVEREFPVRVGVERCADTATDLARIVVLHTIDDSRSSVLRSGEALSRVLLDCAGAGLATCTLTHMIEVDGSRDTVRCLTGHRGEPQALIRVGVAEPTETPRAPSPRLPIDDVLDIE